MSEWRRHVAPRRRADRSPNRRPNAGGTVSAILHSMPSVTAAMQLAVSASVCRPWAAQSRHPALRPHRASVVLRAQNQGPRWCSSSAPALLLLACFWKPVHWASKGMGAAPAPMSALHAHPAARQPVGLIHRPVPPGPCPPPAGPRSSARRRRSTWSRRPPTARARVRGHEPTPALGGCGITAHPSCGWLSRSATSRLPQSSVPSPSPPASLLLLSPSQSTAWLM